MIKLSPTALVFLCSVTAFVFAALYGPLLIPLISSFFQTSHGETQWHDPSFSAYQALADMVPLLNGGH